MSCLSRHIDVSAETQSQNYLHYKQSLVETAGSAESDIVAAVEALKSWPLSPEADYLTGSQTVLSSPACTPVPHCLVFIPAHCLVKNPAPSV